MSMARKFKKAAERRHYSKCRIYGYELSGDVPLAIEGPIILGRKWAAPDIISHILSACSHYNISIIVPFVDAAVSVAARAVKAGKRRDMDLFAPVSTVDRIEAMFDKVAANRIFMDAGLPVPEPYTGGSLTNPLIAKPRHGSASKGLVMIDNDEQLHKVLEHADDYLIQQRIDRRIEYTADCYVSTVTGKILSVTVRRRDEVAGGEVVRTTVMNHKRAEVLVHKVLKATGLRGAVTVQLIGDLDHDDRLMVMEVNPRLGGGAVASVCAGVDLPGLIIDESYGEAISPAPPARELIVARYLEETIFSVEI